MIMTGPEVKVDGLSDSRLMSRRTVIPGSHEMSHDE